jgi:hypothetical protein
MKKMISNFNISINSVLFVILVLLFLSYLGIIKIYHKETFMPNINNNNQLMPGVYPLSDDVPLLDGDYTVKNNTNITKNNTYNNWKQYPVYPSSYKQQTNNVRYWATPDNGMCSPAEFCGTPYEKTNIKTDIPTKAIPIGAGVIRVNWWESKS